MSRALPAMVALLVLCGCTSRDPSPSVLQRYDRMRRELGWITGAAERVALDARRLQAAMSRGEVGQVQSDAILLKTDSRRFALRAGAAGNVTRRLASEAQVPLVRRYLEQITTVLTWQWVEGHALAALADQAWFDPLSVRGGSAQRLAADMTWSRRAAIRAVHAAESARAIRNRAKSQFRYVVATPAQ